MQLIAGLAAWSGLLLWAVKWLLGNMIEHYTERTKADIKRMDDAATQREKRIAENAKAIANHADKLELRIDNIEKEKLVLEKDIVVQLEAYQKREESLRELALIDAKLEGIQEGMNYMRLRLEQLSLTGCEPSKCEPLKP